MSLATRPPLAGPAGFQGSGNAHVAGDSVSQRCSYISDPQRARWCEHARDTVALCCLRDLLRTKAAPARADAAPWVVGSSLTLQLHRSGHQRVCDWNRRELRVLDPDRCPAGRDPRLGACHRRWLAGTLARHVEPQRHELPDHRREPGGAHLRRECISPRSRNRRGLSGPSYPS